MTMVQRAAERVHEGRPTAAWHEVDSGFWVGNTSAGFLGSVERLGRGRYLARDELSRTLGEFIGLSHARDAVVARHG